MKTDILEARSCYETLFNENEGAELAFVIEDGKSFVFLVVLDRSMHSGDRNIVRYPNINS